MVRNSRPDLGASNELWRVMLASGEHAMTLDALDAAFEDGRIDAATPVCSPGSFTFIRLGAIAGLDADQAAADASVDVDFDARVPADRIARRAASIDLTDEARAFRPRWSLRRLLALPAVLGAIAIIAVAMQASAASEASPPASVARAGITAPPPVAAPAEPKPSAGAAPPSVTSVSSVSPALTAPQKKGLAAKDKKAEASRNAKRAAVAPQRGAARKSSSPFTKGGNKHDPLNASL